MTSRSSSEVVRITTGKSRVRLSARMRWSTSIPLTLGSFRSRSTTAGSSSDAGRPSVPKRYSIARTPSCATTTSFMMLWLLSARIVRATSSGLSSTSRIFPAFTRPPDPRSGPSQGEVERGSPIDGAVGPDAAAVPGDDAADRREADAGAFELRRGVQSLEHAEQLVRVLHVEAGAVVPNQERVRSVHFDGSEFDPRPRLLRRVLPAVAEEVLEGHPQQARISPRREPRGNGEFRLPCRRGPLKLGGDVPRHAAQVHDLGPHLRTGDASKSQQVV